jgi:hypothetical protein
VTAQLGTAARLVLFAVLLAVVFVASYAVGTATR